MRKIFFLVMALLLILCLAVPAMAAGLDYVIDDADLLTPSEENSLQSKLEKISAQMDADIVVVTLDTIGSRYIRSYADDYYDYNGYGEDGVLLMIVMDTREYWVSTTGRCIEDVSVSAVEDAFYSNLSAGHYYLAFCDYADACQSELEGMPLWGEILVCLAIGLVIGLITVLVMKGKLKTVRSQSGADSYMRYDAVHLTGRSDIFLYQTVTRRPKVQNNGGGGMHTGSSGRSHGGGGGRF